MSRPSETARPGFSRAGRPAGLVAKILRLLLPTAVCFVTAVLLGLLSWHFWVILLFPLTVGVALGWALSLARSLFPRAGDAGRRTPWLLLATLVVGGYGVEQTFEDSHQRRAFAEALFSTRAASSGLTPGQIAELEAGSGVAFLGRDAEVLLDGQAEAHTGLSGPIGRWVLRLEAGVRLGGPWRGGRGLDLGLAGGLLALIIDLGLALFIAARIVRGVDPGLDPPGAAS